MLTPLSVAPRLQQLHRLTPNIGCSGRMVDHAGEKAFSFGVVLLRPGDQSQTVVRLLQLSGDAAGMRRRGQVVLARQRPLRFGCGKMTICI